MSGAGIFIPRPSPNADNKEHGLVRIENRKGRPTIWRCLYGEDYVEMLWNSSDITYGLFLPQVNAVIYRKIILWSILVEGRAQWRSLRKTVPCISTCDCRANTRHKEWTRLLEHSARSFLPIVSVSDSDDELYYVEGEAPQHFALPVHVWLWHTV